MIDTIMRWIFLIGGFACAFGIAVIFYCLILKLWFSLSKSDKIVDQKPEETKIEDLENRINKLEGNSMTCKACMDKPIEDRERMH